MTDAYIEENSWPDGKSPVALVLIDRRLKDCFEQLASISSNMANHTDANARIRSLELGRDVFISSRRWMYFNSFPLIIAAAGIAFAASIPIHVEVVKTLISTYSMCGASMWADVATKQPRNKFELERYKLWKLAGVQSVPFIIEALPKNLKKEHLESAPIRVELLASFLASEEFEGPLKEFQMAKLRRYCESPDPTRHDQELMREPVRKLQAALMMSPKAGVQT